MIPTAVDWILEGNDSVSSIDIAEKFHVPVTKAKKRTKIRRVEDY